MVSGECSTYGALASHRGVFSCYRAWPIGCEGLVDVASGDYSLAVVHRLPSAVASLVADHRL